MLTNLEILRHHQVTRAQCFPHLTSKHAQSLPFEDHEVSTTEGSSRWIERFIVTLRKMKVSGILDTFLDRLREGGEDFHKVQHIPSIEFMELES
ncbi:hypothetical protein AAG906_000105 [Vitis piasezkii]